MSMLMSKEIKKQIVEEVGKSKESIKIITAFCKNEGMQFIEDNVPEEVWNKRLMVRFRMEDIISGATDISIYESCKKFGWKMYVRFDLHAKTYIFDNKRCITGSANLTGKGVVREEGGNYEIASISEMEKEDIEKIDTLFDNALIMNDEIYVMMCNEIRKVTREKSKYYEWSEDIISKFAPDISVLFTYDFPVYSNYRKYKGKNVDFLYLESNWKETDIRQAFKISKSYLWLKKLIADNGKEMYFGEITENLHRILVNDPRPYRKEVKELLANLLQWIQDLDLGEIVVDRPNYSQRVRIASVNFYSEK